MTAIDHVHILQDEALAWRCFDPRFPPLRPGGRRGRHPAGGSPAVRSGRKKRSGAASRPCCQWRPALRLRWLTGTPVEVAGECARSGCAVTGQGYAGAAGMRSVWQPCRPVHHWGTASAKRLRQFIDRRALHGDGLSGRSRRGPWSSEASRRSTSPSVWEEGAARLCGPTGRRFRRRDRGG